MIVQKLGLHVIEFYDSPENLPIKRFQRFNKFMMIDNEVGSTFDDFMKRDQKVNQFLAKEMYDEAKTEMANRIQCVFHAYEDYSPKEQALAMLIYKINGVRYTDYSDGGLQEVLDKLDHLGFTKKDMDSKIAEVKKKSKWNWSNIFRRFSRRREEKV